MSRPPRPTRDEIADELAKGNDEALIWALLKLDEAHDALDEYEALNHD